MKTLFVTGAHGFVGGWVQRLAPEIAERHGYALALPPGDFDLLEPAQVDRELALHRPEAILHLAAQSNVPLSIKDPEGTFRVNVFGTLRLLEGIKRAGQSPRVVLASSGDVYGKVSEAEMPITEDRVARVYTPLELAGRDLYVREGCYNCHSQMIRTLRDEVERYGHYSLAAESMYDRPFQWGSKRTGPDLARIGGKYSDDWHRDHLNAPKSVVPGTVMPAYPWLAQTEIDLAQASSDGAADLVKRDPKAQARDYDGKPNRITEADALIAYLQVLGTFVDFRLYDDKANMR